MITTIAILILLGTTRGQQGGFAGNNWQLAMTGSPTYRAAITLARKDRRMVAKYAQTETKGSTKHGIGIASADQAPANSGMKDNQRILFEDWMKVRREAGKLLAAGSLHEAKKAIDVYEETHNDDSTIAVLSADIAFRQGKNLDAYNALAPYITVSQSPELLLRLSLAASRLGQSYPGQREYLANLVIFYYGTAKEDVIRVLPIGDGNKGLEELSLLGLAVYGNSEDIDDRLFYSQQELALDKGNPVAATVASQFLMGTGKYREAASILRDAIPRATGDIAYWLKRYYTDDLSLESRQKP